MKLFTLSLSLAAVLATPSHAALALSDALARTVESNPRLRADQATARASSALIEQAATRPNPVLGVSLENFAGTGTRRGIDALEATVEIAQTLERGDKRSRRTAHASRDHEVALAELAVRRAELLASTVDAYLATVAAQQRLALAEEPLLLARDILAATDARVQAGATSPAESARARAGLASAQAEVTRREAALTAVRAALAAHWNGRADDVPTLATLPTLPDTLPASADFLAGLATHPRIAWQHARIARQRAALELEQANASQDISVAGGVRFLRENSDAALMAGVSVPLPVRNKNQGNIRAARELLAGAELETSAIETELRAAFTAAWQELTTAHRAARDLRAHALPASEEAHAVVRRAYEEGHLPLIDVLDAQRELLALRRDILEQEAAYFVALAHLEALTRPDFPLTTSLLAQP